MRRLLLLIGCLTLWGCFAPAYASISFVQGHNFEVAASASAVTISNANGGLATVTAGSMVVCLGREGQNNTSTVTLSDSGSQTWTHLGYANPSAASRVSMDYILNSTAITSITETWSGGISTRVSIVCAEFSGVATSTATDGTNGGSSHTAVTSLSSVDGTGSAITTTNANDVIIFAAGSSVNQASWTAGTGGWTAIPAGLQGNRVGMEYLIVSSIQTSFSGTITDASSGDMAGWLEAFKAGSAPASSPTMPPVVY